MGLGSVLGLCWEKAGGPHSCISEGKELQAGTPGSQGGGAGARMMDLGDRVGGP